MNLISMSGVVIFGKLSPKARDVSTAVVVNQVPDSDQLSTNVASIDQGGWLIDFIMQIGMLFQILTGTLDGKSSIVEKSLDLQYQLDILSTIQALAGLGTLGFNLLKLPFPKSQHIGWNTGEATHLADFEIKFVWYRDCAASIFFHRFDFYGWKCWRRFMDLSRKRRPDFCNQTMGEILMNRVNTFIVQGPFGRSIDEPE